MFNFDTEFDLAKYLLAETDIEGAIAALEDGETVTDLMGPNPYDCDADPVHYDAAEACATEIIEGAHALLKGR